MLRKMLIFLIVGLNVTAHGAELDPLVFQTPQDFAYSAEGSFQWWLDPETKKVNFRRCDWDSPSGQLKCRRPMLMKGIDQHDLPALLDFYCEHLRVSSTYQINHLAKIITGSLGTVTVYAGSIAGMSMLKHAMPSTVVSSWAIKRGIHVVSIGAIGLLLYLTTKGFVELHHQHEILEILNDARTSNRQFPPPMEMPTQEIFDDFVNTFRFCLYEFTHGGGQFEENGYMVFQ